MLLEMGLVGWIAALAIGFVVGGVFFLSIKWQVDYVVHKRGPTWTLPVALYARLVLVAVVLVVVARTVPGEKVPGAMLGGVIGALVARVLVHRMVRRRGSGGGGDDGHD